MQKQTTVGIEAIAVHIPKYFIDLETLANATGVDPQKYYLGLGGRRMSIIAPNEDPVTMAVDAAFLLFEKYHIDPATIGLLVVGTESGVDGAKPIASHVHGLANLPPACRTFDIKHACYSGTVAVRVAADWCMQQGVSSKKKALVITTDIARYGVGNLAEPTQGAGAVAAIVGLEPAIFAMDSCPEAVYTEDVMDFWRPNYRSEAIVDGQASITSYLKALTHTYTAYRKTNGIRWTDLDYLLFHVPFPKMAKKAFTVLYGREQEVITHHKPPMLSLEEEYDLRTRPSLWANMELGNIYSGSLYLSLAGLLERGEHRVENAHLGLFSYGSGSCSEFFTGRFGDNAAHWQNKIGIGNGLKKRTELSYQDYLEYMQATSKLEENGSYAYGKEILSAKHNVVSFCGIQNHQRIYAWSEALASTQKRHRIVG